MVKHTCQTNDPSGNKLYDYNGILVEPLSTFIYEITINKYWKNGYCQLGRKLYKSDRLLNISNNSIVIKYNDYTIEKEISLIGVPQEFINEMNLPLYIFKKTKKLKKHGQRNGT